MQFYNEAGRHILKKIRNHTLITMVVVSIAAAILGVANSPPILPSSFYGTVMVNGAYVSDGTIISAWIGSTRFAEVGTFTFEAKSVYTLEIPADNPGTTQKEGGQEGDTIVFKIGSAAADQTGTWHSGTNVELNLAASTAPPPPAADFGASPTTGDAPLTVAFVDNSTGSISAWSWDFGDSSSSTAQNPAHEYTTPGTYTVALTVTGPGGSDTQTRVAYITVTEPVPEANFSGNPQTGVVPKLVSFTDLSSGNITSWNWEFGDGGTSTAANPSHEYTTPGTYTVALTVSGPGGSDTKTRVNYISIYEEIIANFSAAPTSGAAPLDVSFSDSSSGEISSWFWNFGDGGTSTQQYPGYQYLSPGIYTVTLAVSGPAGSDTKTRTNYIDVSSPGSTVAEFTASPKSGPAPLTVSFTDLSSDNVNSWSWNFGDGGTSSQQNPVYTYSSPGTYPVSLSVTSTSGDDMETKVDYITVSDPAAITADFEGSPRSGEAPLTVFFTDNSSGDIESWSWNFGDGGGSTQQNPSHQYTSPGSYTVSLSVSGSGKNDSEVKVNFVSVIESKKDEWVIYLPITFPE